MAGNIGVAGVPVGTLVFDESGQLVSGMPEASQHSGGAALGLGGAALLGGKALRSSRKGDESSETEPETDPGTDLEAPSTDPADDSSGPHLAAGTSDDGPAHADRRSVIKKVGAGAAIAWAVPSVLSFASPAAAGSAPSGCAGCSAPPVVNPGAETGDITGWTLVGTGGVLPWNGVNTVDPGNGGAFMFYVSNPGVLSQSLAVPGACANTGAHTFQLSFIYAAAFGPTALLASVEFFQGATSLGSTTTFLPETPNPNPGLGFVTAPGLLAGAIPVGADSAVIGFNSQDTDALIDNIAITFC